MNKIIKEFVTIFIYMSIALLFILGCMLPIALVQELVQEGHPICAFFTFNFFATSLITLGNAIINKT